MKKEHIRDVSIKVDFNKEHIEDTDIKVDFNNKRVYVNGKELERPTRIWIEVLPGSSVEYDTTSYEDAMEWYSRPKMPRR